MPVPAVINAETQLHWNALTKVNRIIFKDGFMEVMRDHQMTVLVFKID